MVVDSSALLAILFDESDRDSLLTALTEDPVRLMSAVCALEVTLVMEAKRGPQAGRELELFLHRSSIEVVPFDPSQLELARSAWRRYGKGNHPAALNLCDCCSYALAKRTGEKLLYKGQDFARYRCK